VSGMIGCPCTGCFSSALLTRNNKLFLPKGTSARIPTSENAQNAKFAEFIFGAIQ
jgi:hypothetical protein